MKKIILITFLLAINCQLSFAQQAIAKIKFEEAEEAYAIKDFETTVLKLDEAEVLLKTSNPRIMYLKILAQSKIIEKAPLNEYKILEDTRQLCAKYLNEYESIPNNEDKYRDIYNIGESLKVYPTDKLSFEKKKKKILDEEIAKQQQIEFEKKIALEKEEKNQLELLEQNKRYADKNNKQKFTSLGFESGEIAKYGLIIETAGINRRVGFHFVCRSSFTSDDDILKSVGNDLVLINKFDFYLGPNIRIFNFLYLNLGIGGGGYKDKFDNGTYPTPQGRYSLSNIIMGPVGSIGTTIRLGRVVNINIGLSYMDIPQNKYDTELTYGISFNLVKKMR